MDIASMLGQSKKFYYGWMIVAVALISMMYVTLGNGQELRIRVESKSFLQEDDVKKSVTIGWNKEDTVLLKKERAT